MPRGPLPADVAQVTQAGGAVLAWVTHEPSNVEGIRKIVLLPIALSSGISMAISIFSIQRGLTLTLYAEKEQLSQTGGVGGILIAVGVLIMFLSTRSLFHGFGLVNTLRSRYIALTNTEVLVITMPHNNCTFGG
eukprot:9490998-Pyramimonas_sp.AAC.1